MAFSLLIIKADCSEAAATGLAVLHPEPERRRDDVWCSSPCDAGEEADQWSV